MTLRTDPALYPEPALARWLLALVTPARERQFLLGDMAEEYAWMIVNGPGPRAARRWYWSQVRGSIAPGLRRLRPLNLRHPSLKPSGFMSNFAQDISYAVRTLLRKPMFTAVALATLAIGIGANVTMFSVVQGVLLTPLSYGEPDRVVRLFERRLQASELGNVSYPDFHDISERSHTLVEVAATQSWLPTTTIANEPYRVFGVVVSGNYFDVLQVQPTLGRFFLPEEDELGHAPVVVVSHSFWRERLGSDPNVAGQTLELSGTQYTIVGVAPAGLEVPRGTIEVWRARPDFFAAEQQARTGHNMQPIARLAAGVTLDEANAELTLISEQLELENPQHVEHRVTAVPMMDLFVGDVRSPLLILFVAVGAVLLIACTNIANLLLSRAAGRYREVAIRTAMGARRSRLVRQFLTESLVLAVGGAILGLGLAIVAVETLNAAGTSGLPRTALVAVDGWVLAFTALAAVGTALIFGVMPALHGTTVHLAATLKEGGRTSGEGTGRRRWRRGLVVAEVALAVMLLTGAGLLLRSFANLQRVDAGFEPSQVLTLRLYPPAIAYPEHEDLTRYYQAVVGRLESMPGVVSVGAVSFLPMSGGYEGDAVRRDDRPPPEPGQGQGAEARAISPDYFHSIGASLLDGRAFTSADDSTAPQVLIINEALAQALFPGEEPLGKRVSIFSVSREIVGVVNDVRQFGVREEVEAAMYAPHAQPFVWWIRRRMSLSIKTAGEPMTLAPSIRQAVWDIDPTVPIRETQPLAQLVADDIAQPRLQTQLLSLFAGIALFLAAVGIAAVMGYNVAQRRGEIGVRMALGAERSDVLYLVLWDGMKLVLLGLAIGLAGSAVASRLLQTMLFGVSASDMQTYVTAPAVLAVVAMIAVLIPALRASRMNPLEALREE